MKTYSDQLELPIQFPTSNGPSINWKHIDGPLLYFSDGQLHWLTLGQRIRCHLGMETAESLEHYLRPNLMQVLGRTPMVGYRR
jgi:hypothetical protein